LSDLTRLTATALLLLLAAAACQDVPPAALRHASPAAPTEAVLPTSTSAPPASPALAPQCRTENLAPRFAGAQGAAATTFLTFRLSNVGAAACGLQGFVDLQMLDAAGNPLPTRVVRGGHLLARQPPASSFSLSPAAAATFLVAYSHSPGPGEKDCPEAYQLLITPPNEDRRLNLAVQGWSLAPCRGGELDVGPLRPAAMTSG
jgi:hypothetical protein